MNIDFIKHANPEIYNLTPYQQGNPTEEVERELGLTEVCKLASNENPLGASPAAKIAVQQALTISHIYPDGNHYEIKHALAHFFQIAPEQLTIGNGSENVLEIIIKSYLNKNDEAIISQYAFLVIPILLQSYGINTHVIPAKNWEHDIEQTLTAINEKTKIIFLVNPNNPTGTFTTANNFKLLMENIPPHILVVADEAYAEYVFNVDYPQTLNYLTQYPNLIITRTFSKAYGLAGLRLGYAISSVEIANILNRARLSFNVNSIAAKAGCAALNDQQHVKNTMLINQQGMQQLMFFLNQWNIDFIPSVTNFITMNVGDAAKIYQALLLQGVIVRPLNMYGLPQYIRVTISHYQDNLKFLQALEKTLLL